MSENPRVPLGEPIIRSEADVDRLAQITPEDIEAGKALWRRGAPKRYRRLLDAEPEIPDAAAQ